MVAEQTRVRTRPIGAPVRRKRGDTHIGTIERQYGLDFGVRSDMHLATLLERRNAEWLAEILRQPVVDGEAEGEPEAESAADTVTEADTITEAAPSLT